MTRSNLYLGVSEQSDNQRKLFPKDGVRMVA